MELSSLNSSEIKLDQSPTQDHQEVHLFNLESKPSDFDNVSDNQFRSMSALEILRETVRVLRFNSTGFVVIAIMLICPVSALFLSNILVDQSVVKMLTIRLILVAKSSGLPLMPIIENSCQRFAETILSSAMCFPFFVTFSLISKAAVVHAVDCTYLKRRFEVWKFCALLRHIWIRLLSTYVSVCLAIVGCLTLFSVLLGAVCSTIYVFGISPDLIVSAAVVVGLVFSVVFANAVIICNIAIVISVLEVVSGPEALLRSCIVIRGQTQVGLLIYLVSTMGTVFVEGLFEHRVKTLSYGDGSSRLWEGPLLVVMYSFVVLTDSMMSAVFYFSCRSSSMEEISNGEHNSVLDIEVSDGPTGIL